MADDGFGDFQDFNLCDFIVKKEDKDEYPLALPAPQQQQDDMDFEVVETGSMAPTVRNSKSDRVYKHGLPLDISPVVGIVFSCTDSTQHEKARALLQAFILLAYGQRNLRKQAVDESKLTSEQLEVYQSIREEMAKPERRKRILEFIDKKEITRRLINYFVVHYALVSKELSYYLDRRTYPYKIIGELNNPNQPEIVKLIDAGENIVWLNFHQQYKNSKHRNGRRNRHAPYRRSTSVHGSDGAEYSLCELNFYLWLDDVGGFDLFYRFENEIRDQKAEDARIKRQRDEEHNTAAGKKKKEKIVLRKTDGKNYKTYAIECNRPAAFSSLTPTCSFDEFMRLAK